MRPAAYVPIDISGEFLKESAAALAGAFPQLPVFPVRADFTGILALPEALDGTPRLGFFPGSTIGNLEVPAAVDLLRVMAATLGARSMLLIGIDRIKDGNIILPVYDDTQGVTAADGFNLMFSLLPDDWLNFAELAVPELQRRGLTRKDYLGGTLRDRLGLPRPANRFASK